MTGNVYGFSNEEGARGIAEMYHASKITPVGLELLRDSVKGSERVWFEVTDVICPDDDYDDYYTEITLICECKARSHRGNPTDGYGENNRTIVVLERWGRILDIVTVEELEGADPLVTGSATYMWDFDDPDGYWHLDALHIAPNCEE